jgi:hypothetical protein
LWVFFSLIKRYNAVALRPGVKEGPDQGGYQMRLSQNCSFWSSFHRLREKTGLDRFFQALVSFPLGEGVKRKTAPNLRGK